MKRSTILFLGFFFLLVNIAPSNITNINNNMIISEHSSHEGHNIFNNDGLGTYKSTSINSYESDHLSNYTLSVILHEEEAIVEGNLTVDYYNDDLFSFNRIPFHLFPSGMRYNQTQGNVSISEVKNLDLPSGTLDYEVITDEQLMWVNLTEPLDPTERVSFQISFNTTLPDGGIDRANYHEAGPNSKIFKFAAAYPMPAVYDEKDGWNIDSYLNVGDPFYSDMAWYDFYIEAPLEMVIAATGKLLETIDKGDTLIHHYNPELPVRGLTFSASKYFIHESAMVNGVNVSTYYLPKSEDCWQNFALSVASNALILYNNTFGDYPYPTLNIVMTFTHFGGMEYPLQVYISEAYDYSEYYTELIIAHETCHQWFYHLVGNDEIDAGFLDEGLVVWATDFYFDYYYPEWELFEDYYLQYQVRHYNVDFGRPNKINQSVYECSASYTDYWYIAYDKAPMILQKLRVTIGNDDFISGLQLYFDRFQFKIAWLPDLQQAYEDVTGCYLDWFFNPWFDNIYLPKYNFKSINYDANNTMLNLTIEDLNEIHNDYPYSQQVPLEIYDINENRIFISTIWINGTIKLTLNMTQTPVTIKLDYTDNVLAQSRENFEYLITNIGKPDDNDKFKICGIPIFVFMINSILMISIIIKKTRK